MEYQIGLDTGGTFTDAVLVDDERHIVATAKALTRHDDLLSGLAEALDAVCRLSGAGTDTLAAAVGRGAMPGSAPGAETTAARGGAREAAPGAVIAADDVTLVSLSTTLATNALVENRGRPVGLILIGVAEERLGRARLAEALGGDPVRFIAGGHDAAGNEIAILDETSIEAFMDEQEDTVEAWAISALFSTRNPEHEERARRIVADRSAHPVSLGHTLSEGLDAPRRALTALLNARLVPLVGELLTAADALLRDRGIAAPLMVVKGDGSLIAAELAARSPVETILSGPAASLVGAQYLCGEALDLMIADTGGTTTDIARLENGRPRLAADGATVGGWRTMVRAVDMQTVAIGGDGELFLDVQRQGFRLGARRVVPLSLLACRYPETLGVLKLQMAGQQISSHDGRFALLHRRASDKLLSRLGRAERELLAQVQQGPIALVSLFAERSREAALTRLEDAGLIVLAGFTPSDVSHLLGTQSDWQAEASDVGARLLMRFSRLQGGPIFDSPLALAKAARRHVAERVALAIAEAALDAQATGNNARSGRTGKADDRNYRRIALTDSQRQLMRDGLSSIVLDSTGTNAKPDAITDADPDVNADMSNGDATGNGEAVRPLLQFVTRLGVPIAGLGAPATTFHGLAAALLDTTALLPVHGCVANALGAVMGHVRQSCCVTLISAGGGSVRILLDDGPVSRPSIEEGVACATEAARTRAVAMAEAAGVGSMVIETHREDDIVERDGSKVFLECRVTVTATGRPASGVSERV